MTGAWKARKSLELIGTALESSCVCQVMASLVEKPKPKIERSTDWSAAYRRRVRLSIGLQQESGSVVQ